ncbi:K+/H+ antiporter subunit F [Devosia rhizoryzae]|uniref:K+/H+ antiporter subunit F n=1 Tax=Devosia rhizoryzae TaxID=2774137 RepID=A0ABX7C328_9HYPH|nr:K+/H+ antiporter subunit F [Devosia rhizoryzae]QQR38645.1 K+/H+ antiporter subunit F [Devosia rhizoryzae]
MSAAILFWSITLAQVVLAAAMLVTIYRLIVGPRAQDRVLSLDSMYVVAMLLLVTFGMRVGTVIYFEVALLIGLLGFVGTVALAKFLMRGEVIE